MNMNTIKPYIFLAPALLILSVFSIYPILHMITLSFYEWNMISPVKTFVGLTNFINLVSDVKFYQIIGNTLIYVVFTVGLNIVLGMALALFLNKKTKINSFLQSIAFFPYIVSLASISLLWMWIMNKDFGLLNALLEFLHLQTIDWLGSTTYALISLIIISVWKGVGYNALIILASLQSVPKYLYEAARLNKASSWKIFRKITLPMISPTVFFLTLMDAIASFKVFETIQIITEGGPQNSTNTLVFALYEYGFHFYKIGYAASIGVVLFLIIAIFTIGYFVVLSKKVHYQ